MTKTPTLITFIQDCIEVLFPQQSGKKMNFQAAKEGVKLSLFADDIMLYIENPKHATKKLLKVIKYQCHFSPN